MVGAEERAGVRGNVGEQECCGSGSGIAVLDAEQIMLEKYGLAPRSERGKRLGMFFDPDILNRKPRTRN